MIRSNDGDLDFLWTQIKAFTGKGEHDEVQEDIKQLTDHLRYLLRRKHALQAAQKEQRRKEKRLRLQARRDFEEESDSGNSTVPETVPEYVN